MLRSSDVSCSCQATGNMVASTTLTEPLEWQNSTLLQGDLAEAVLALKQEVVGMEPTRAGRGYRLVAATASTRWSTFG